MNIGRKNATAKAVTVFLCFVAIAALVLRISRNTKTAQLPLWTASLTSSCPATVTPAPTDYFLDTVCTLRAKTFYFVQCASLSEEAKAHALADELEAKGVPVTIYSDNTGYKLFADGAVDKSIAQQQAQRLGNKEIETYVKAYNTPEIDLDLQGISSVTQPLKEALNLFEDFPERLTACRDDAQALSALLGDTKTVLSRLKSLDPAGLPPLAGPFLSFYEESESVLEGCSSETTGRDMAQLCLALYRLTKELNE